MAKKTKKSKEDTVPVSVTVLHNFTLVVNNDIKAITCIVKEKGSTVTAFEPLMFLIKDTGDNYNLHVSYPMFDASPEELEAAMVEAGQSLEDLPDFEKLAQKFEYLGYGMPVKTDKLNVAYEEIAKFLVTEIIAEHSENLIKHTDEQMIVTLSDEDFLTASQDWTKYYFAMLPIEASL